MPLEPGSGKDVISRNISEMVRHGYARNRAVAAALKNARKTGRTTKRGRRK
jgi:hypothetical protein